MHCSQSHGHFLSPPQSLETNLPTPEAAFPDAWACTGGRPGTLGRWRAHRPRPCRIQGRQVRDPGAGPAGSSSSHGDSGFGSWSLGRWGLLPPTAPASVCGHGGLGRAAGGTRASPSPRLCYPDSWARERQRSRCHPPARGGPRGPAPPSCGGLPPAARGLTPVTKRPRKTPEGNGTTPGRTSPLKPAGVTHTARPSPSRENQE